MPTKLIREQTTATMRGTGVSALPSLAGRHLTAILPLVLAVLVIVAALIYTAWHISAAAPRSLEAAPLAVATSAAWPTPIAYPTILATFPDAAKQHGYTLMCKGQVWEFPTQALLWEWQAVSGYKLQDCKCFQPRAEGQGYRECPNNQ